MNEKITVNDFLSPLGSLEQTLDILEEFYLDERFENMDDAFELIENYKRAVRILKEVKKWINKKVKDWQH